MLSFVIRFNFVQRIVAYYYVQFILYYLLETEFSIKNLIEKWILPKLSCRRDYFQLNN